MVVRKMLAVGGGLAAAAALATGCGANHGGGSVGSNEKGTTTVKVMVFAVCGVGNEASSVLIV